MKKTRPLNTFSYLSGKLFLVSKGSLDQLPARERRLLKVRDEMNLIRLRDRFFDTMVPQPRVPKQLQRSDKGEQLHLVQFVGPVQDDWVEGLRRIKGLQIVSHMPENAYLVWADEAARKSVAQLADLQLYVQWQGPFHPAYKIHPGFHLGFGGKVTSTIQLVTHEQVQKSVAFIKSKANRIICETYLVIYNAEFPAREAVDIVLVLDISGSMNGIAPGGTNKKIDLLKDAVEMFVRCWEPFSIPGDKMAVVYFNSTLATYPSPATLAPFQPNANNIIQDVRNVTATSCTGMGGGIKQAYDLLTGSAHPKIVVFTDGMQNCSPKVLDDGSGDLVIKNSTSTCSTCAHTALVPANLEISLSGKNIPIHTIGTGVSTGSSWWTLLEGIANQSHSTAKNHFTTQPDEYLEDFFLEAGNRTLTNWKGAVTAMVARPAIGFGAFLVKHPVSADELARRIDLSGDRFALPAAKKSYILMKNETLRKELAPKVDRIRLYDDGRAEHGDAKANDGVYSALYNNTRRPGFYNFRVSVNATDAKVGTISRSESMTVSVRMKEFDLKKSSVEVKRLRPIEGRVAYNVSILPVDSYGNHLGPGHSLEVAIVPPGKKWGPVGRRVRLNDNLDGRYSGRVELTEKKVRTGAGLSIYIDGKRIPHVLAYLAVEQ